MLAWYGPHASFPPPFAQPHQSQGEWSPCTDDGPQHELPGLAGRHHVFQNDLSWSIGSLPRLSFPLLPVLLSHPSKHLTILLVLPTPSLPPLLQGATFLNQCSHTFVSWDTQQGEPHLPLSPQPYSLSLSFSLLYLSRRPCAIRLFPFVLH